MGWFTLGVILLACSGSGDPDGGTTAASPALIEIVRGDGQTGSAGEPLPTPVRVRVVDAVGTPVPLASITFAVTQGGGFFDPEVIATGPSGEAAVRWTLGSVPGPNRAEVRVGEVAPVTLEAIGQVGEAAVIRVVAGGGQSGVADWPVPVAPAVVVEDAHGNPIANLPVTFGVAPTDGQVRGALQVTNAQGRAQVDEWILPRQPGPATLLVGATGPGIISVEATALGLRPVGSVVAAHGYFTCGLRPEGEAFCFGTNEHGQRGDSVLQDVTRPWPVAGQQRFTAIAPGREHACGLAPGGQAHCWGLNTAGQLGDGSGVFRRPLPAPVAGGRAYSRIASGDAFTCALNGSGTPECWGSINGSSVPASVTAPVPFVDLAAGAGHACGRSAAGAAYCWGLNGAGQLGDSSQTDAATPVAVTGGLAFTMLDAGTWHTCGLTADGTAYCWGANRVGQLADGTQIMRLVPTQVSGSLTFTVIRAGGENTCALTAAGAAYCCGDNGPGAVGIGAYSDFVTTLMPVVGGHVFTRITAGGVAYGLPHVCALATTGDLYCWGSNSSGQLGNSDGVSRHTPTRVEH